MTVADTIKDAVGLTGTSGRKLHSNLYDMIALQDQTDANAPAQRLQERKWQRRSFHWRIGTVAHIYSFP